MKRKQAFALLKGIDPQYAQRGDHGNMSMAIFALVMILAAAVYRLLPVEFHPYNLAPIGAMALMGGMFFGRRFALWVPLAVLFITDAVLNVQQGYALFYWPRLVDYGFFAMIGLMGYAVRRYRLAPKLGAALATPFIFFFGSNLGVWLFGLNNANVPYDKTFAGLVECFTAALPFFRGTLFGDYLFISVFVAIAVMTTGRVPELEDDEELEPDLEPVPERIRD
jgi:hypothetical protein